VKLDKSEYIKTPSIHLGNKKSKKVKSSEKSIEASHLHDNEIEVDVIEIPIVQHIKTSLDIAVCAKISSNQPPQGVKKSLAYPPTRPNSSGVSKRKVNT